MKDVSLNYTLKYWRSLREKLNLFFNVISEKALCLSWVIFLVSPKVWILYFNIIFCNIKFAMGIGTRSDSSFHYTIQISLASAEQIGIR